MFDKFGEFDSVEELNMAAEGLKNEGDFDNLIILAKENGIDEEDAQDYIDGLNVELATVMIAALGKLKMEREELRSFGIMEDWIEYIRANIVESNIIARNVRRKDKSLVQCMGKLLKWSFENAKDVDEKMVKAAGINAARCKLGIPGMREAKRIIKDYYTEG